MYKEVINSIVEMILLNIIIHLDDQIITIARSVMKLLLFLVLKVNMFYLIKNHGMGFKCIIIIGLCFYVKLIISHGVF